MRVKKSHIPATVLLLILAAAVSLLAQPAARPAFDPQEVIPFDAAVTRGTLPNGLQYYVRRNVRPAGRVALRLAVKAGSLDEADDQQGLAHFLEHMAFNGSANFPPGELISFFERTGARLGPHVNAYTSFDETVYMLDLPTDVPEVVARGFTALADYAGRLTIDPGQVDKERGVVIEEWRGRLGAGSRIRDRQLPLLYYKSRYAERLPIGKPEILRTAPAARLRAFYDTWYRPDRMAVIVVGDLDQRAAVAAITSNFAPLAARGPAVPREDAPVPVEPQLAVSVTADPEVTQSTVQLVGRHPSESQRQAGDYRRGLVDQLFQQMFNERFDDLARRADSPYLSAGAGGGALSPTVDTFSLSARVPDGSLARGLTSIAVEARRVREFGFTLPELDRAKRWMSAFYERAYNERDRTESGSFAQEYLNHYLTDEPSPGIEWEYRLAQDVLPGITLEEVNARARGRLGSESRVLLAVSPEKPGLSLPTEESLRSALAAADAVTVTPWTETTLTRRLMETPPTAGAIESRRELSEIGVTIVRFGNGVEVWLKPTDFKNDQVVFTMYAQGGASLAAPEDYPEASLAATLVSLAGVGGFTAPELEKVLAGRIASASPFVSLSTHGVSGSASPGELETALQLLNLTFTAPGGSAEAFALLRRRLDALVANRGRNPNEIFAEKANEVTTANHYTALPWTAETVASLDQATMTRFYRERFRNAADFTVFMVGALAVDDVLPLLARYVGSLPADAGTARSAFKDVGVRFPAGIVTERVKAGREPRGQTILGFYADVPPDPTEQERIIAATTVLETALRDELRESLGQTYTVSVGLAQSLPQRGDGFVQVSFGSAPENIPSMVEKVVQVVRQMQQEGPSQDLTSRAKESARRGYELSLKQNPYWMRRLQTIHMLGGNPEDILNRNERIEAITPEAVRETFRKYFPTDRRVVVTLEPAS
jgi:zinc protease